MGVQGPWLLVGCSTCLALIISILGGDILKPSLGHQNEMPLAVDPVQSRLIDAYEMES